MDRQIPDVWNIFSISGPPPDYKTKKSTTNTNPNNWSYHHNWNVRSQEMLHKWSDRTSPCDRPRTYDKFYAKLPCNYIDPRACHQTSKSHGSLCSSEAELEGVDHEEAKKRKKRKRNRKYSRTVTERDVRHLERHLSMKKTIRKKIMRDLQQAFVNDNVTDNLDCNRLNFDPKKRTEGGNDAKLLDLLKQEEDSGLGTDDQGAGGNAGLNSPNSSEVHLMASLPDNHRNKYLISDSSSCSDQSEKEDIIVLAAEQIQTLEVIDKTDDSIPADKPKKRSFWQKLTGKKS
eukprot:06005.XXX_305654_306517_1 [CDS] Oithona nana genome sequencing.